MGQENMHCLCYCQVGIEGSPLVLSFGGSAPHYCWIEMEIPGPHYPPLIPPWLGDLGVPCYCSPNYLCWHGIVEMGGRWRVALLSLWKSCFSIMRPLTSPQWEQGRVSCYCQTRMHVVFKPSYCLVGMKVTALFLSSPNTDPKEVRCVSTAW